MEKIKVKLKVNEINGNLYFEKDDKSIQITNWVNFKCGDKVITKDELLDSEIEMEGKFETKIIKKKNKEIHKFVASVITLVGQTYQREGGDRAQGVADSPIVEHDTFAPYNFIPLNEEIIAADNIESDFQHYNSDKHTGFINVEIKNETPLFIRGDGSDFYSVNGTPTIPGSSLRGLTRSIAEILSYSKMEFVNKDKKLFFRNIGSRRYRNRVMQGDSQPLTKPGWIFKRGRNYYIQPAEQISGLDFYRINAENRNSPIAFKDNANRVHRFPNHSFHDIYFKPTIVKKQNHPGKNLHYALVTDFQFSNPNQPSYQKGNLVLTGLFGIKKHLHWIIGDPLETEIEISRNVIEDYENDKSREDVTDLLLNLNSNPIPCFYLQEDGVNITSFGSTPLYRIPYSKTIGEHIVQSTDGMDMATAIFGDTDNYASKVSFEDLKLNDVNPKYLNEEYHQVLLSPKPTSSQLYLECNTDNRKNWDDNVAIRGSKMYWHKKPSNNPHDANSWAVSTPTGDVNPNKIKPLASGALFIGRIRFENLTSVQLGLLKMSLTMNNSSRHKIGLGKPLGLGTIKIEASINLTNRDKRYESVFTDNKWNTGELKQDQNFIEDFKNYMQTNGITMDANNPRLKELYTIMNYHKSFVSDDRWLDGTSYMELGRFRINPRDQRTNILPKPSEIKK